MFECDPGFLHDVPCPSLPTVPTLIDSCLAIAGGPIAITGPYGQPKTVSGAELGRHVAAFRRITVSHFQNRKEQVYHVISQEEVQAVARLLRKATATFTSCPHCSWAGRCRMISAELLDKLPLGKNDKLVLQAVDELGIDDPVEIAAKTGLSLGPGIEYRQLCELTPEQRHERLKAAVEAGEFPEEEEPWVTLCLSGLHVLGLIDAFGGVDQKAVEQLAAKVQAAGEKKAAPVLTTEDAQVFHEPKVYPIWAWEDTAYADFARASTQGNYVPPEFFVESIKTVVGGIAGHLLGVEGSEVEGRFYTVLISEPGTGKSTAMSWALDVFPDSLVYTHGVPLWPRIGCYVSGFGSQVGIVRKAAHHRQILQVYDEFSTLSDKFKIHGSGLSFLALINQLYERTLPPSNATKDTVPDIEHPLHNSILGATTPDVWRATFGGTGSEGSGFFQRLNVIASEEKRTVPRLVKPDLSQFATLVEKVKQLADRPYEFPMTPEASEMLQIWYEQFAKEWFDDVDKGRLQVLALRTAAHLGWLLGVGAGELGPVTPKEVIRRACAVANWQIVMRRKYKPLQGDTVWAMTESQIVRVLKEQKVLTRGKLYKAIHGERVGFQVFGHALQLLEREGLIRSDTVKQDRQRTQTFIWTGDGA